MITKLKKQHSITAIKGWLKLCVWRVLNFPTD
uniref:Uncharacterized protein n=1 Tax=Anguilla anguilla TaxID=7936 RepID=A0A0E9SSB6_ANGAN